MGTAHPHITSDCHQLGIISATIKNTATEPQYRMEKKQRSHNPSRTQEGYLCNHVMEGRVQEGRRTERNLCNLCRKLDNTTTTEQF